MPLTVLGRVCRQMFVKGQVTGGLRPQSVRVISRSADGDTIGSPALAGQAAQIAVCILTTASFAKLVE